MADKIEKTADEATVKPAPKPAEPAAKAVQPAATVEAPYPSQADIDAIKDGTFGRTRDVKAGGDKAEYKTR